MSNLVRHNQFSNRNFSNDSKRHYSVSDHVRFLDTELHAQNEQFLKLISRTATGLLQEGLLLPAKFTRIENGHLIVKTSTKRPVPRKEEYLTAVLLEGNMPDHRNWHQLSWKELRENHQVAISESICIWQSKSDDSNFNLIGFRGVSVEFASKLINDCIIVFGPKEPPREYLMNLKQLVESHSGNSHFLNFEYSNNKWNPVIFDNSRNFPGFVLSQLEVFPFLIVQGPPGTGKTHKLAELISVLLEQGMKILVTALTNRALIELAKKEPLLMALELGQVTKINLSIDEANEIPELLNKKDDTCTGELILSTFYSCSNEALEAFSPHYDYVIMDEASQSLLAMIEATTRLGTKVIWIGDQNQLPPIVQSAEKEIIHQRAEPLINGMQTLCEAFNFPSLMFNQTYRLSNRGARFTSKFYKNEIKSARHYKDKYVYPNISERFRILFHADGGPHWLQADMPVGDEAPIQAIEVISQLVKEIYLNDKTLSIAVLTKLKKTVTQLQLSINSVIKDTDHVLIETVERVQGMTCDICIFLIPNKSLSMSLNQSFFNVATSRASRHTIIVADPTILDSPVCKAGTRMYFEELSFECTTKETFLIDNGI